MLEQQEKDSMIETATGEALDDLAKTVGVEKTPYSVMRKSDNFYYIVDNATQKMVAKRNNKGVLVPVRAKSVTKIASIMAHLEMYYEG
ncbi:hypothetical protein [Vibrio phage RYC]|nr:hypothetical protein [Vibrio phage RYC]